MKVISVYESMKKLIEDAKARVQNGKLTEADYNLDMQRKSKMLAAYKKADRITSEQYDELIALMTS